MKLSNILSFLLFVETYAVYEQQEWYDRLWTQSYESGIRMKECSQRSEPPQEGSTCAWKPKMCYFGTQTCADGLPYPVTECSCSGGLPAGTWSCIEYTCPGSSTQQSGSAAGLYLPEPGSSASATLASVDAAIRQTIIDKPDIAASYVRLGFHDCVPNGPDGGGCDGCINLANPSNNGLDEALISLAPITEMYETEEVSRADIWAYSAMVASDATQTELSFVDNFKIGRLTCETRGTCNNSDPVTCSSQGPDDTTMFPTADFSVHEILDFFVEHFGMNAKQTVALLGAHTLGIASRENSGYNGTDGWVFNNTHLDNDYYVQLATSDFVQVEVNNSDLPDISDEHQWVHEVTNANGQTKTLFMLNSDVAFVRDVTLLPEGQKECTFNTPVATKCPLSAKTIGDVEAYAEDNMLWLRDFKDVMTIMIEKIPGELKPIVKAPLLVAPSPGSSASNTLARVDTAIRQTIIDKPDIAASYVRLGFHDCVPNGPDGGGCDGCINLANPSNNGLDEALISLAPITEMYETEEVSRADIWAYSAMVASDATQTELSFVDTFKVGRRNCETRGTCSSTDPVTCSSQGPDDTTMFPTADFSVHEILDFFVEHFGMNAKQTVALLGAHTLGIASRENSGYNGTDGWVFNNTHLDNDYYVQLATSDFVQVEVNNSDLPDISDEHQWNQEVTNANGQTKTLFMLNSDVAFVRDVTLLPEGQKECTFNTPVATKCPLSAKTIGDVEAYAEDNMLWLRDFKEVMTIMIEKNP